MAKDYAKSFYHSRRWKDTQAAFMTSRCYVCERCGSVARIVHHKVYITPQNINDVHITLSWDNLEALCMDCHTNEHLAGGICAEGLSFDENGDIAPL